MAADSSASKHELQRLLSEREKELDAIYEFASLVAQPGESRAELLERTASILRRSMQFPDLAVVHIRLDDMQTRSRSSEDLITSFEVEKAFGSSKTVSLMVGYTRRNEASRSKLVLVDREKRLVASTADLLSKVLERVEIDDVLRESTRALQRQADELAQKNAALREILSHIQHEKDRALDNARAHVSMFVDPYLHRLRDGSHLDAEERACVGQIERSLQNLFSREADGIVHLNDRLSPRELEVCDLVRNGLATKQIASFLHLAPATVERHRNTIRKKLGLSGSNVSLTSFLRSLE